MESPPTASGGTVNSIPEGWSADGSDYEVRRCGGGGSVVGASSGGSASAAHATTAASTVGAEREGAAAPVHPVPLQELAADRAEDAASAAERAATTNRGVHAGTNAASPSAGGGSRRGASPGPGLSAILPHNPRDTAHLTGAPSPKRRIGGRLGAVAGSGSVKSGGSGISRHSAGEGNRPAAAAGPVATVDGNHGHGGAAAETMGSTGNESPLVLLSPSMKFSERDGILPPPAAAHARTAGTGNPSTPLSQPNPLVNSQITPLSAVLGSTSIHSAHSVHSSPPGGSRRRPHALPVALSLPVQDPDTQLPSLSRNNSASRALGSDRDYHSCGRKNLDNDEQYMFEQRLTQDDLGVAVRKINHSGKAQLRYVKCVPLRPPSSSEFGLVTHPSRNRDNFDRGVGDERPGGGYGNGNAAYDAPYSAPTTSLHDLMHPHGRNRGGRGDGSISSRSTSSHRSLSDRIRAGIKKGGDVSERLSSIAGRVVAGGHRGNSGGGEESGGGGGESAKRPLPEDTYNADLLLHSPQQDEATTGAAKKSLRALTWGKKNAATVPLDRFVCVRKGKTTDRTARNSCPASRLLSVVTTDSRHGSLDIEAPTRLDRDKFALAFSTFLGVPLEEEVDGGGGMSSAAGRRKKKTPSINRGKKKQQSAARSEPGHPSPSDNPTPKLSNRSFATPNASSSATSTLLPVLTPNSDKASAEDRELYFLNNDQVKLNETVSSSSAPRKAPSEFDFAVMTPGGASSNAGDNISEAARKRISSDSLKRESMLEPQDTMKPDPEPRLEEAAGGGPTIDAGKGRDGDDASHVSSLTGGVDQEIVEELHQAIIELRAELDASRAEAARAVKVAEQAIQSAENCSSSDWNSTVTHKAAEAAAQAQKKSAEAIARARMAEDRLASERKSTAFWRRQAQAAEEEAGSLKTRSAAAEVKRAVMMEELASEKRTATRMLTSIKRDFETTEESQRAEMRVAIERKWALEVELDQVKNELIQKSLETKRAYDAEQERKEKEKSKPKARYSFGKHKRQRSVGDPEKSKPSSVSHAGDNCAQDPSAKAVVNQALQIKEDVMSVRKEYEFVRRTSTEELNALSTFSKEWSARAGRAVAASQTETILLREKLASESAMRLKLLNELQDIRGTVRVYCRPKPAMSGETSVVSIPTHDILVLNEDTSPLSFKFDRVFAPNSSQVEVFSELEEPIISALDGFNVTLLAFGQHGSGKTHSLLGNHSCTPLGGMAFQTHGALFQALQQLFTIADHRSDRFKDSLAITNVEVYHEKLFDLLSGTAMAESKGEIIVCQTKDRRDKRDRNKPESYSESAGLSGKLEIRTNIDGNTVVQGLISTPVNSFEEACTVWKESIAKRTERLQRQGIDLQKHERQSNIITTVSITSVNIATGVGTEGKLQFVDMAASDIAPISKSHNADNNESAGIGGDDNIHFFNKSIDAFNDVVNARYQFDRSVPYRNSTLTHLLRDTLEADTKVLLLCCVSSDAKDIPDTVGALRFALRMQKVSIGKATKHITGSKA